MIIAAVLIVLAGCFLHVTCGGGLEFGRPAHAEMDDYFIARGQRDTAANNIVTAVVFDFRAIDTLGEATVLFVAVLGAGLILRRVMAEETSGEEGDSQ
jgi:multisubunit Na+/H+ antiporter MnhB subunit